MVWQLKYTHSTLSGQAASAYDCQPVTAEVLSC